MAIVASKATAAEKTKKLETSHYVESSTEQQAANCVGETKQRTGADRDCHMALVRQHWPIDIISSVHSDVPHDEKDISRPPRSHAQNLIPHGTVLE